MVGFRARDVLDEDRRAESLALRMNLCAQPAEQAAEIASCKRFIQATQIRLCLGVKLGSIKVSQRVGRKITDQPGAPVDVLQASFGVVARRHAQSLAVLVVPGRG